MAVQLEVTARLVKEVLGGALETSGDLSAACRTPTEGNSLASNRIEAATNVLTDTLSVLTSSQIKVGRKGGDETEDDSVSTTSRLGQRSLHKQRLLSKISRKHLMEIVLPIVCNLKTVLESSRSPLHRDLMQYLGYIFRSYKREATEYLANDPTTLQELQYDLKQYRKKKYSLLQSDIGRHKKDFVHA